MTWADLFDRGADYGVDLASVRAALYERRTARQDAPEEGGRD